MFDILFQLKDIETDRREQIYEAEIKKETPYRHKGGTAYDAVDAASNYTGFGVSDKNDTTVSGELQASEKTDLSDLSEAQKANAEKVLSKLKQKSRLMRNSGKPGYIGYAADRITQELMYSKAEGEPDYAKSYIAWVDPLDFVFATATLSDMQLLERETEGLDLDKLRSESQPIYLVVNMETGDIKGHEGRHRMIALQKAGYDRVPVIIDKRNADEYGSEPISIMELHGQRFGSRSGKGFFLHDMLPLSERYEGAAKEFFSDKATVQFSEKTGDRSDLEVLQQAYEDSAATKEQQQAMVSFREQVQRYEDARSALTIAQTDDKNESTPASRKAKPEAQRTFNREQKIPAGMVNNNADLRS